MTNPKVVEWIKHYSSQGHNFQELEDFLSKNGYDQNEIENAINEVKKSNSNTPKILIYTLILVVFLALISGGIYYFMIFNSDVEDNRSESQNSSANNNQLNEDELENDSSLINKSGELEKNQTNNISENNKSSEDSTNEDISDSENNETIEDNLTQSKNMSFSISMNGSLNGSINVTINNSDLNNSGVFDSNEENDTQEEDLLNNNDTQEEDISDEEEVINNDSSESELDDNEGSSNETTQEDTNSCDNLPQKLNSCEPFTCQLKHPFTGELVNRSVVGIENDKCRYVETTPGEGEMVCNYPEFERKEVSKYYEDLETSSLSTYTINGSEVSDPLQKSLDIGLCEMNIG